jgi:phosphotriesterase-related protein
VFCCTVLYITGTILKNENLLEFSSLGTYCQFDLFGTECSLYQLDLATDMPSDAQRMDKVMSLIQAGKEDRILIAHDIHTKHRLVRFLWFAKKCMQSLIYGL